MPEGQTDIQVIEKLESDVLGTTQELQNLQGSINGLNAEEKAQVISENSQMLLDIQQTIKACREECNRLEQENKAENAARLNQLKANLAKLEQIYTQVNQQVFSQTNADLNQLSNDTIASQNQSEQNQDNPDQKEPEKKGIRGWWKGLTDGQRRGIRIAGGVGAGIGIFGLLRRRRRKKETTTTETTPSSGLSRREARRQRRAARRAKPFWDRPIGKVVKWTAIGGGVYYVVHGLVTGKWNPKDLGERGRDRIDDSISQVSAYEKLSEEQREQYEKIGNGVNDMYGKIREKEIALGFEDKNKLGTISNKVKFKEGKTEANYAGLVPFCMDKDSDNIKEILSEKDMNEYFFNKNISELKSKIKGWTTEKLEKLLGPFVDKLQSFQVFGSQPGASLGEKIRKWLDYDSEERDAELDFFFRQYSKVLVFLKDKETTLKYKIAENILKTTGYDGQSLPEDEDDRIKFIQEVLDDSERVKNNIENNDTYKKFMESKLVSVNRFLESQNIPNTEISAELGKRLEDLDEDADDILQIDENNNTIVDRGLSEISGGLSDKTGKNLMEMCDDIQKDMANETGTGFIQEYFEWLTYACNTEDSNRETFLKESGLLSVVEGMSSVMNGYKEKIKNKTITADDLQKLKQVSLEYTALKKEIEVAMYTMKSIKDDDPDAIGRTINTGFKLFGGFCKSVQNIIGGEGTFGDWLNVGISIAIVGGVIYVIKHPLKAVEGVTRVAVGTVGAGLHAAGRAGGRTLFTSRWLKLRMNTLASKGVTLAGRERYFLHFILNGQAREEGYLLRLAATQFNEPANSGAELIQRLCKNMGENLTLDQAKMVWKYGGEKNLKKMMMSESTDRAHATKKDILLHNKATRQFKFHPDVLDELKVADDIIEKIPSGPQKKYMESLLKKCGTAGKFSEDIQFVKKLAQDEAFLQKIGKENIKVLKKIKFKELKALEKSGAIDDFIKGQKSFSQILEEGVPRLSRQAVRVEQRATTQLNKEFNKRLGKEISKLEDEIKVLSRTPGGGQLEKNLVSRLKTFQAASHSEDEAKAFLKLMDEGFDVKYLSHIDDLFTKLNVSSIKVGDVYEGVGTHLKKLLIGDEALGIAPDYAKFRKALTTDVDVLSEVKRLNINTKPLIGHMDDFFKFGTRTAGKCGDDLVKAFAKVLSKIF